MIRPLTEAEIAAEISDVGKEMFALLDRLDRLWDRTPTGTVRNSLDKLNESAGLVGVDPWKLVDWADDLIAALQAEKAERERVWAEQQAAEQVRA